MLIVAIAITMRAATPAIEPPLLTLDPEAIRNPSIVDR
jgi:hypothetical protein